MKKGVALLLLLMLSAAASGKAVLFETGYKLNVYSEDSMFDFDSGRMGFTVDPYHREVFDFWFTFGEKTIRQDRDEDVRWEPSPPPWDSNEIPVVWLGFTGDLLKADNLSALVELRTVFDEFAVPPTATMVDSPNHIFMNLSLNYKGTNALLGRLGPMETTVLPCKGKHCPPDRPVTVPAPAPLGLMVLGLAAVGLRRRII